MIQEITVDVSFLKHTLTKRERVVTEGDYSSTKLIFRFEEEIKQGYGVRFKMSNPKGDMVLFTELDDLDKPEIILAGYDEEGNVFSLFPEAGLYPFELVLYSSNSKLTSAPGWLVVGECQVDESQGEGAEYYLPLFEQALKGLENAAGQSTDEGGEIFNDYENNIAIGEGSSARGLNTQAGTLARKIVANGIASSSFDTVYQITVNGLVNSDELCTDAWVATDTYIAGTSDLVTVDCSTHLSNAFYISKIEENSETNTTTITLKRVDDRVTYPLTMDDITGANREEDWIYVPGKLNGEISPQFTSAFAGGKNSVATGFAAMSFGRDNISAGNYSVTLGRGNKASYGGLAAGIYNETGNYGIALGNSNKALADNSVATGVGTYARAASSRAGGRYSRAESEYSVAEGLHVIADARVPAQVVFGRYNRALDNSLFIIGNGRSDDSRANALEVRTDGTVWILDGTEKLATSNELPGRKSSTNASATELSIYDGYTDASGDYSLASGYSKATGEYSTALGWSTASNGYSLATGYDTSSTGFASAAFGYKTQAAQHAQFVVGQWNEPNSALFVVGNGTSKDDRNNAFEVHTDGSLVIGGVTLTPEKLVKLLALIGS